MKFFISILTGIFFTLSSLSGQAQYHSTLSEKEWVDSVFQSLTPDEKIAQLMVVRAHSNLGQAHINQVMSDIEKYNIGALCFFQGGPVRQANLTNQYQAAAKTPLMITMDAEWGLGMRLDSVTNFPYQLTLGATKDTALVYRMGVAVGKQAKRLGVHVNYAPTVDVNNNPRNPVIGFRSFGEDKYNVSSLGVAYMKGMQQAGIMACAKHFPGHGDVAVDSHLDLPVINKSREALDTLEMYPFKELIKAGVGSVMVGHLYVPAIDNTKNKATSLSRKAVTGILREELGYDGIIVTDAIEMDGVAKYFPGGTIAVESLAAGNDMLCLPKSVATTIDAVKQAIAVEKLSWDDIDEKLRRVLHAKYRLGLCEWEPINTNNLLNDLNAYTDAIREEAAEKSITLVTKTNDAVFDLSGKKVAYVALGANSNNDLAQVLKVSVNATVFSFGYKEGQEAANKIAAAIARGQYDVVVIGVHGFSNRPANNYGISAAAQALWKKLNTNKAVTLVLGNVLALEKFCAAQNLVAVYQDDAISRQLAGAYLNGDFEAAGTLPVSVCSFPYGHGIVHVPLSPEEATAERKKKLNEIDSIANDAIARRAFPGCVVMALHKGEIIYHKAFGKHTYAGNIPVTTGSIYDVASLTKTSATALAVMKLYEEGKIDLKKTLGTYLPVVKGTNKANLILEDLLLHQAGLIAIISFYKETIDKNGLPDSTIYQHAVSGNFSTRVGESLYLRNDWQDTLMNRIITSRVGPRNRYIYSDNDFIFLGKLVEAVTGKRLDYYLQQEFYTKMNMVTTGFRPLERFVKERIVPTEYENGFRRQLIWGDVHDEGAAMLGGIAGHAGLFSTAYDIGQLYQMLLNGGEYNGVRLLEKKTIDYFTAYHSRVSRRGLGFDKPEKDNAQRKKPYPAKDVSAATYGHTGFTGTCVWVDPVNELVYVFLSNRVHPARDNNTFSQLDVRGKIQETLYKAIAY